MVVLISSMTQLVTNSFNNGCIGFIYDKWFPMVSTMVGLVLSMTQLVNNCFNNGCFGFIYDTIGYQLFQQWLYGFHLRHNWLPMFSTMVV